jgi:NifU-like protein involved in Fe-S cluster formation
VTAASAKPAAKLYTPEILELATGLADYPLDPSLPLQGEARSRTCGSMIRLGMALDGEDRIARIGMQVSACAIGQASAMLLAQSAGDTTADVILTMNHDWERWLAHAGPLPDWPGAAILAPARDHPARHGALLLPWKAASVALSSAATGG